MDERPLIVVSNRLPVAVRAGDNGDVELRATVGGLASALAGVRERRAFTWVGWPGELGNRLDAGAVEHALVESGYLPITIPETLLDAYYTGMCNSAIWPLFHYFLGRVASNTSFLPAYREVNQSFAARLAETAQPGAHVWIHDYHLMLVPRMLRALRPDLRISFFLHIPFPSSEVYRILPARAELLHGLLGADYIGFHTGDYVRHFRSSCLRVIGVESGFDHVEYEGRRIGLGVHPIGADVRRFLAAMEDEGFNGRVEALREQWRGRRVLLGVERLDYSKAVPLKLAAYEEFLRRDPTRASTHALVQVVVPSRLDTDEYRDLKSEIEHMVGRINGSYGRPGVTPIEYLHRQFDIAELAAMYRAADVAVVIPARDGMNLVAHEYVLCQSAELDGETGAGALVLSEFAGASHCLSQVLLANPWDTGGVSDALEAALAMPAEERRDRMQRMRERVVDRDCERWAERFLAASAEDEASRRAAGGSRLVTTDRLQIVAAGLTAPRRVLLLDYDGSLRELTRRPGDAAPTQLLRDLLRDLTSLPNTEVHIVSGRDRETLSAWLGDIPLWLCAEHGHAWRPVGETKWTVREDLDLSWLPRAEEILREVELEVDESELERKPAGLAWHYRRVDPDYGEWRARELALHLAEQFAAAPVDILTGRKVVELRANGADKGNYVRRVDLRDAFVLAVGDDRTDYDVHAAVSPDGVTIHVGPDGKHNRFWVESPLEIRGLLRELVDAFTRTGPQ